MELTYDGLKTEKTFRLFHNDKFYTCDLVSNGYKRYKKNIHNFNLIPTNQMTFKDLATEIKYQYAIEYKDINNQIIYIKSWCYIPHSFLNSFENDSFYNIYNTMEYYLENYLKNKCNFIKNHKEVKET